MADDNLMDQDEIERLLSQAKTDTGSTGEAKGSGEAKPAGEPARQTAAEQPQPSDAPAAGAPATDAGAKQPDPQPATASPEELAQAVPGDEDRLLAQEDIEKLLSQAGRAPAAAPRKESSPEQSAHLLPGEGQMSQRDMELLLNQAEEALASIESGSAAELPQGVTAFRLEELKGEPASVEAASFELVRDVELEVKIELGRTHMYLEDVLKLRKGSVVPLDKLAGDPVDVYVNGRLVARGEVLVLNDNFCIRVAELVAGTNPNE